jgi:hypothetical protein
MSESAAVGVRNWCGVETATVLLRRTGLQCYEQTACVFPSRESLIAILYVGF